ncbi:dnaJ domain-containing protein [Artemisia annua]|uniref:DnaJ domain-containing protein n=1 Tax=Artemisia annua TaxID=35608 RepID=A0A2U1P589_ARTAN|nr:dnaJ domain-containing protein [Artemisia annua]
MVANGDESSDFYQVLGLKKGCTDVEVKNAYKKLAMRWHPDRCSAFGSSKHVEEAKKKFQAIQEAYSVLSNENKRFLYDVGVYDSDDEENGMSDFLSEMAEMMSQNKPAENGEESFEQLKNLFDEMFQSDIESLDSSSQTGSSTSYSSLFSSCGESSYCNKRGSSEMSNTKVEEPELHEFCIGTGGLPTGRGRNTRKGSSRKGWR